MIYKEEMEKSRKIKKQLQNIIKKYDIKIDRDIVIPNDERHRVRAM